MPAVVLVVRTVPRRAVTEASADPQNTQEERWWPDGSAKLYPPPGLGQTGTEAFVVLADPEDDEVCVLRREPS